MALAHLESCLYQPCSLEVVLEVDVAQSMYNVAVNTLGASELSHK